MGAGPLRTAGAGTLRPEHAGAEVRLAGWVKARRDHGGVIFLDLRDASGVVQVVVDPAAAPEAAGVAREVRDEFCVALAGTVRLRPAGIANPDLPTGEVEVAAAALRVLSPSDPLPFQIDDRAEIDEVRRLAYRYLDLRRPRMAANLRARSVGIAAMRRVLDRMGFLEVETPTLIRSTPEGARDMLVPSRLRPGTFYALPQSPQLFKQLLMVGGVERYFQVARCYRDEDFRSDRQLEFTQLDIEGSFWGQDDILATLEEVMVEVVSALDATPPARPFPRLAYSQAMARFGTDKPDLRFGMEIVELGTVFASSRFQAFRTTLESGGLVAGIDAGPLGLSRSGLDALADRARALGGKGLVTAIVEEGGTLRSTLAKHLDQAETAALVAAFGAVPGDTLLLAAGEPRETRVLLGKLRLELGQPKGHRQLRFLWVVDFPVFEVTPEGGLAPAHHPFTSPVDVSEMEEHPERAVARAYDLVLNGTELGSGSVRIHDPALQRRVFSVLGISDEEAERRFGWFLRALRFGAPPHAGFAVGIDRLFSVLLDEPNIREVIPFPKTQTGLDPMTEAPTAVVAEQLRELGIDLRPEARAALEGEGEAPPG
ncbi:MAG: aspartate--tRNA ligase [Acidimicrobiia bacterium]|nr:aspartate--tRNA ligase [Acidimicrobiia bacterium]